MNETASSGVRFSVGQIITLILCAIVGIVFYVIQEPAKATANDIANMNAQLNEQKFYVYENNTLNGSHVINLIRQYQGADSFGIQVSTGKNPGGVWYLNEVSLSQGSRGNVIGVGNGDFRDVTDERSVNYINPSGKFQSDVVRDANNVIRAVVFTQTN